MRCNHFKIFEEKAMKRKIRFYSMYSTLMLISFVLFGLLLALGCADEELLAPAHSELEASAQVDDRYAALEAENSRLRGLLEMSSSLK